MSITHTCIAVVEFVFFVVYLCFLRMCGHWPVECCRSCWPPSCSVAASAASARGVGGADAAATRASSTTPRPLDRGCQLSRPWQRPTWRQAEAALKAAEAAAAEARAVANKAISTRSRIISTVATAKKQLGTFQTQVPLQPTSPPPTPTPAPQRRSVTPRPPPPPPPTPAPGQQRRSAQPTPTPTPGLPQRRSVTPQSAVCVAELTSGSCEHISRGASQVLL